MRRFRLGIGDLMRIVLILAVLLYLFRGDPLAWTWVSVALLALLFLHLAWFVWLPGSMYQDRLFRGQPRRKRVLLEWIVATPSLLSPKMKAVAVSVLAQLDQVEGRNEEAERLLRQTIARGLHPANESMFRNRLADLLAARGAREEAEAERRRAEECLLGSHAGAATLMAHAQALEKASRYDEAIASYQEAIAATQVAVSFWAQSGLRRTLTVLMARAALEGGRPEDALRWAREALALKLQKPWRLVAHQLAALAAGELGQFDVADALAQDAFGLVEATGSPEARGEGLALQGFLRLRRGDVAGAAALAERARVPGRLGNRMLMLEAQLLQYRGQFRAAAGAYDRFRSLPPTTAVPPELRDRFGALGTIQLAFCLARAGAFDEAAAVFAEPNAILDADRRLARWRDALAVWVRTGLGQADAPEVAQARARVEPVALHAGPDRRTRLLVLVALASAAAIRGEHAVAIRLWCLVLDEPCDPIDRPRAWSELGACWLASDNIDAARAAFREAAESGIETFDARQARDRLAELTPV